MAPPTGGHVPLYESVSNSHCADEYHDHAIQGRTRQGVVQQLRALASPRCASDTGGTGVP